MFLLSMEFLFMKKIIILLFTIVFLSGCGNNWDRKVQLSTLKLEDSNIVGKMKNTTNNAYNVKIIFNLLSGTLEEEKTCEKIIKPNETLDFECYISDIDDSYTFNVKNVELNLIEIPELTENPSEEAVKYYFQNIYDNHKMNFEFLDAALNSSSSQSFVSTDYIENKLGIVDAFGSVGSYLYLYSKFDENLEKLSFLYGEIDFIGDEVWQNEIANNISLLVALNDQRYLSFTSKIEKALLSTNLSENECLMVSDLCIMANYDDENNIYTFAIEFDR